MKEPEQHFSPESIDQLTERCVGELPVRDSQLIADLYQTYASSTEENRRSLQRIWNHFAQVQQMPLQEGQRFLGSTSSLPQGTKEVNVSAEHLNVPVHGSFQQPSQPLPQGPRRARWSRRSRGMAVAVVLLIVLSWVLLTQAFPTKNAPTALGASLILDGGSHFDQKVVLLVKSSEGGQYLAAISFDTYDGHTWRNAAVSSSQLSANKPTVSEGSPVHLVTQQITLVNPPGEAQPYIFGTGQIASVDRSTTLLINKTTGGLMAVLLNNGQREVPGDHYTVQSYVSSADVTALKSILLPADAPKLPPNYNGPLPSTSYNAGVLSAYLQLPKIDARVKELALQLTANAPTMYDKVTALETYFREHYTYNSTIAAPPPGVEATSWFLFRSKHGFCNYFATAMAVMARELGIPARVVTGYTSGTFDAKSQNWVVHSSDAHAWTQIYFAGYGWINFEPSPTFPLFPRLP